MGFLKLSVTLISVVYLIRSGIIYTKERLENKE